MGPGADRPGLAGCRGSGRARREAAGPGVPPAHAPPVRGGAAAFESCAAPRARPARSALSALGARRCSGDRESKRCA